MAYVTDDQGRTWLRLPDHLDGEVCGAVTEDGVCGMPIEDAPCEEHDDTTSEETT